MHKIILFFILAPGLLLAMQGRPTTMTKDEKQEVTWESIDWRKIYHNEAFRLHLPELVRKWERGALSVTTTKADKIFQEIKRMLTQEGVQLSPDELRALSMQVFLLRDRLNTYENYSYYAYGASCLGIAMTTSLCTASIPEYLGACCLYEIVTTIGFCFCWWLRRKKTDYTYPMVHFLNTQLLNTPQTHQE